ncbi:MAG TPA: 30S ribosome-binding factor RbfA [Bacillota bacterium]|nr:30S ribosome-binding factor RbfA [Bacillota bacterium]
MGVVRANRVAEEIKKEVSNLIRNELKDPRIGFVTITSVEVSNDLSHARVFFSTLGSEEDKAKTLQALNKAQGFIKNELGRKLRLRFTPDLSFRFDESIEHGAKIMELLHKVQPNPAGESEDDHE